MACVLVVDDDEEFRRLVRLTLEFAGLEVWEARDGFDALDMLRDRQPSLVLLDVMMPRMDGLTLCRTLRADPNLAHLPVVMISGKTDPRSIDQGLASGVDEYITKPFGIKDLVKRVRALLDNHQGQEKTLTESKERVRMF